MCIKWGYVILEHMEDTIEKPKRRSVEQVRALAEARERGVDPVGIQVYGEKFTKFMRLPEYVDLLPAFKEFYYQAKVKNPNEALSRILRAFNAEVCEPMGKNFYPSMPQTRIWRKKWDLDLMQQMTDKDLVISEKKNIHQVIKTRNEQNELVTGIQDNDLEAGVKTLGGELLNDAMQMLRDDQELDDIYTTEELIKRRNYVVNVFSHATRLVHGKSALMLKASEEKRNTASFLMSLLARATAGTMTEDEMNLLKTAYAPKVEQQPTKVTTNGLQTQ